MSPAQWRKGLVTVAFMAVVYGAFRAWDATEAWWARMLIVVGAVVLIVAGARAARHAA